MLFVSVQLKINAAIEPLVKQLLSQSILDYKCAYSVALQSQSCLNLHTATS